MGFLRLVFFLWLLVLVLKALTLHHLGAARYDAHLSRHAEGALPQQAAAWLLQPGRASSWLADRMTAYKGPAPAARDTLP